MIKMTNLLKVLKWRIRGGYDPEGPVTKDTHVRALNRAKYEAWKYNTFGPGRYVFRNELAYQIIDSGMLQREPLRISDPERIAALASIIAEMEGHNFIAMIIPIGAIKTREDVEREEAKAIDKVVQYFIPDNLPPERFHESRDKKYGLGILEILLKCYTGVQVIEPDVPRYREYLQREFRRMLETLKQYNNPK